MHFNNFERGKRFHIFVVGTKYPTKLENVSKANYSVLVCGSAGGTLLPPFIVFKAEHVYRTWLENRPQGKPFCDERCCAAGSFASRSDSGWIDAESFTQWFINGFLPHAKRLTGKKVLLGDNLPAHITPEVVSACAENDISFAFFVPNSTHLSQPLDVVFFRPFKEAWRYTLAAFKREHPRQVGIPKGYFAELLKKAFIRMDTVIACNKTCENRISENLKSGFAACGIFPHDPTRVLSKLPNADLTGVMETELVTFLGKHRFSNEKKSAPRTARPLKRDRVVPGKPVSVDSLNSDEEEAIVDDPKPIDDLVADDPPR